MATPLPFDCAPNYKRRKVIQGEESVAKKYGSAKIEMYLMFEFEKNAAEMEMEYRKHVKLECEADAKKREEIKRLYPHVFQTLALNRRTEKGKEIFHQKKRRVSTKKEEKEEEEEAEEEDEEEKKEDEDNNSYCSEEDSDLMDVDQDDEEEG